MEATRIPSRIVPPQCRNATGTHVYAMHGISISARIPSPKELWYISMLQSAKQTPINMDYPKII